MFILERSNFTGHRGLGVDTDIGSAYAMWLVDLRDRGLLRTAFTISDWLVNHRNGDMDLHVFVIDRVQNQKLKMVTSHLSVLKMFIRPFSSAKSMGQ